MSLASWLPLLVGVLYLAALAGFIELVERRDGLSRLARHPATYGLALGVYATTWSFYGSVGFAARQGYVFLAVHLGVVLSCLAIPVLWRPLAELVRRQRLQSVADLLAFRFQSQAVGVVVTLFLVLAALPYFSLQLRAIVASGVALAPELAPKGLGLAYAGLLSLFAALVGARWADAPAPGSERRSGLLAALALESLIKCVVLVVIGVLVLGRVFDGPAGLDRWLAEHPEALVEMFSPVHGAPWAAICFASFIAAFLLPRQFHVAFVERPTDRALRHATWTLPALLLAINAPLPILYWAGRARAPAGVRPDLWVLELAREQGLGLLVFLGGVSAASAMILIACVALSGMIVNHVVLPLGRRWALSRLTAVRRVVIVALVFAGFLLYVVAPQPRSLVELGLASFAAVAQLLPGVLAALFWPRATRRGLLWGLAAGIGAWAAITFFPLLGGGFERLALHLGEPSASATAEGFPAALWLSLLVNVTLVAVISLTEQPRPAELAAAAACARREAPGARVAALADVAELGERLRAGLGDDQMSAAELARGLGELGLDADERRPLHLRRLAETVERNLAERVGPLAAAMMVSGRAGEAGGKLAAELRFLEQRGEDSEGSAAELVRRYLSGVLTDLPLAVCTVDEAGEILLWNRALAELTELAEAQVIGGRVADLPEPWGPLLAESLAAGAGQREVRVARGLGWAEASSQLGASPRARSAAASMSAGAPAVAGAGGSRAPRILRLTCTALGEASNETSSEGQVGAALLVEDLTERRALRAELSHRDRLSSVGRFAAGVAHEMLNPLTGILMVARNVVREVEASSEAATEELELPERLSTVVREGERIERIVRSLLTFSRGQTHGEASTSRGAVELAGLVDEAVALAKLARRGRKLVFSSEIAADLAVIADRHQLLQVLINLLTNAADASPDGARVRVRARADAAGGRVDLEVLDEGVGIDAELAERVFEPFFTTKAPGEGTGLGLAVSHRIVAEHGGELAWRRRSTRGTAFVVSLPAVTGPRVDPVGSQSASERSAVAHQGQLPG